MVNPVITPMVIAARIRRYFSRFENAGAVNPESAQTLTSLGLNDGILFRRLLRHGVFIEHKPGSYYVSRASYERYRAARRFKAAAILGGIVIIFVVISYLL
jgi:hypothetical protein